MSWNTWPAMLTKGGGSPARGGPQWGARYEVDYRTLPTQALTPQGAHIIDGLTYYNKGAGGSFAGGNPPAVLNGLGLSLGCCAYAITGAQNNCVLWFPAAQVVAIDFTLPLVYAFRLAEESLGSIDTSHYFVLGAGSLPDDGASTLNADRGVQSQLYYQNLPTVVPVQGTAFGSPYAVPAGAPDTLALYAGDCPNGNAMTWTRTQPAGSLVRNLWTDPIQSIGITNTRGTNPGVAMYKNNNAVAGYVTQFAILQPMDA